MRRIWLLSLLALPVIAGATATIPPQAQARDVFGLLAQPMRMIQNLGLRGRLYHRRARPAAAHPAAAQPSGNESKGEPRREAMRAMPAAYWPDGYDDLMGFTFAPSTGDRFWQHGSLDILTASLSPSASTRVTRTQRVADTRSGRACDGNTAAAEQNGTALYQEIEKAVQPTEAQREAFKELREAMIAASKRIDASCSDQPLARAGDRLKLLADRFSAMRQAMLMVRTPLEKAYNGLSDVQKARLDGSVPAMNCQIDLAAAGAWPSNEIMRAVQPNEAQQQALERFRGTFLGMSQQLASACPKEPPGTVLARLDAAGERLNGMLYATRMVNRALDGVYASLDDQQRGRLQSVGRQIRLPSPRAAELGPRPDQRPDQPAR